MRIGTQRNKLSGGIPTALVALAFLLAPFAALAAGNTIFQVRQDWKYKNYETTAYYGTYYTTGGGPKSSYTTMSTTTTPSGMTSVMTSTIPAGTGPIGLGTTWSSACATGYYCLLGTVTGPSGSSVFLPSGAAYSRPSGTTVLQSTYHIPGYPGATRYYSLYNLAGYFYASHSGAATTPTTVVGATQTTRSGNNYAFSRGGNMQITPGPNRFGGTMRFFFGPGYYYSGVAAADVGYAAYRWNAVRVRSNSGMDATGTGSFGPNAPTRNNHGYASTDPQNELGATYTYGSTQQTHTYLTTSGGQPLTYQFWAFSTIVPWTTGMAVAYQDFGYYITQITFTGTDDRTAAGKSGTLSLVQPLQYHNYKITEGSEVVESPYHTVWMRKVNITMLPEPGAMALLGIGILGMGGLYAARKR